MFGPYVIISAGNHSRQGSSYRYSKVIEESISIGKGTWIGSHVSLLGGSHIGEGSLVASNACVTKGTVPNNAFIVGVPAKDNKYLDDTNEAE